MRAVSEYFADERVLGIGVMQAEFVAAEHVAISGKYK